MSSLSAGDVLYVCINKRILIADGLCMGGFSNISGIHIQDAPDLPIHVHGDVETNAWFQVTVREVRSAHIIADVDHPVDGRSGTPSDDSEAGFEVWWVDTNGADCFHASSACEMLKKREGERLSTKIECRNKPVPDEISDLRRCSYCH